MQIVIHFLLLFNHFFCHKWESHNHYVIILGADYIRAYTCLSILIKIRQCQICAVLRRFANPVLTTKFNDFLKTVQNIVPFFSWPIDLTHKVVKKTNCSFPVTHFLLRFSEIAISVKYNGYA